MRRGSLSPSSAGARSARRSPIAAAPSSSPGTIGAWTAWAVAAVALAVTGVVTLTVVRAIVPASIVVAAATAIAGASGGAALSLAVPAVVATVLVGSAETGRRYVETDAYGDERRFPLRPPYGYLAATVVTWAVWVAALLTAPLALAAGSIVLGVVAVVVAVAATWLFPRRWHQLSRRWLVVVPAGVVVHDPVVLADTLMLPRRLIAAVGATTTRGPGARPHRPDARRRRRDHAHRTDDRRARPPTAHATRPRDPPVGTARRPVPPRRRPARGGQPVDAVSDLRR